VDDSLQSAILGGETTLRFNPQTFLQVAGARQATTRRSAVTLGDMLLELRSDLADAGVRKMADATVRLADRWQKAAAGTAEDIDKNLAAFEAAYRDFQKAHDDGISRSLSGDSLTVRRWANVPWVQMMDKGVRIADGIVSTRSIPRQDAKGMEMAYRLYMTSRQMPKDIYKWWKTNKRRIELTIMAAKTWPVKQEGTNDLFTVGSFRVHNVIGLEGSDLEAMKRIISEVEKLIRKNPVPGFNKVLYGDIHIVSRLTKAHNEAWYQPGDDSLYVRWDKKGSSIDRVQACIHELGHRYLHKFSSKTAAKEWQKHHWNISYKSAPNVDYPGVGDEIPVRVKGMRGHPIVTKLEGGAYYYETPRGTSFIPASKVQDFYRSNAKLQNFPTPYSSTSAAEHFCEAVALYAMNKLPSEHAEALKTIWG